ncbi:hypothetical protein [Streptomyces sp. NPDC059943]
MADQRQDRELQRDLTGVDVAQLGLERGPVAGIIGCVIAFAEFVTR